MLTLRRGLLVSGALAGVAAMALFAQVARSTVAEPAEAEPVLAESEMGGLAPENPHIELTPARDPSDEDWTRADRLVATAREATRKYADVKVAERDGYRPFAATVPGQKVIHYTNVLRSFRARSSFDPAAPPSLLYARAADGTLTLHGVMYTAAPDATLEELDARVPLGVAQWHRHVNICLPPAGSPPSVYAGREPRFGPRGSIATDSECEAAGGRFFPQLFGWMVHVNVFAGTDRESVWANEHAHQDAEGMVPHQH